VSDEPKKPEDLLKWGRLNIKLGAIELSVAAALYCWHLDPGTWLHMLRFGATTGGLIALTIGLIQLYAERKTRRR
jgi:hypothetical protein